MKGQTGGTVGDAARVDGSEGSDRTTNPPSLPRTTTDPRATKRANQGGRAQ